MNTIDEINKLSQSEFVEIFGNIFEKARWIAEKLYNEKPFNNFEELRSKMLEIFINASKEIQIKVLNAHPDLADKTKIGSLATDSKIEQNNAGLNRCFTEEFNEFKNLNNKYKKKFGFPFILAVKGRDKIEILNEFKKRILNNKNDEFGEALIQVVKIANLRLKEFNMKKINL